MRISAFLLASAAFFSACSSSSDGDDDGLSDLADGDPADAGAPDARAVDPLIAERPYDHDVPEGYDPATPTPLVVVLHGYGASGLIQAAYFGARFGADEHGFLLAYPNGTYDLSESTFWNATDGCCNFDGSEVDDVAYVVAIVDDMAAQYNVDPRRVYLMGHSNGGFMAHRLACEHPDRFAAIFSLAGMTWADPEDCPASERVNVLQLHGDDDQTILYLGGSTRSGAYPSAADTVATWAAKNGCAAAVPTVGEDLDLSDVLPGAETARHVQTGCPAGGAVELWTMRGGTHLPSLEQPAFFATVWAWFEAHPKP